MKHNIFFTENQLQILALLLSQETKDFNLSEVGKSIGKSPGVFQRSINTLERAHIIKSKKRGNQRIVMINHFHPFFAEIKNIVTKTLGIEGLLKDAVVHDDQIILALIYGSYAKETMRPDSDIDLLLVVNNHTAEERLLDIFEHIEKKIQRDINYILYMEKEFLIKRRNNDPFLDEVFSDKYILLKGKIS